MKQKKLIIGNLIFAILMVVLFSPGLVGLSFESMLTYVVLAISILGFIAMNKILLAEKEKEIITKDNVKGASKAETYIKEYVSSETLGDIARSALNQMEKLSHEKDVFEKLVRSRFEPDSLSYTKFMSVMNITEETLKNGYMRIANKMIVFDEKEYILLSSGAYRNDAIPDDIQEEKLRHYQNNLNHMRDILNRNEEALFGIDKLLTEISESENYDSKTENTVNEINSLLEQMEYYKK